jgi:hypothetical protein
LCMLHSVCAPCRVYAAQRVCTASRMMRIIYSATGMDGLKEGRGGGSKRGGGEVRGVCVWSKRDLTLRFTTQREREREREREIER